MTGSPQTRELNNTNGFSGIADSVAERANRCYLAEAPR